MKSEGFFGSVSAHARSRPLALALRGLLSDTVDEAQRLTKVACSFPCHSEPVRTPVRNLIFRKRFLTSLRTFEMTAGRTIPLVGEGLAPPVL